jgi:cell wall-associated NlpC family hydrolase
MGEVPIKRGTARRLGLNVPLPCLTARIEPDLSALKAALSRMASREEWAETVRQINAAAAAIATSYRAAVTGTRPREAADPVLDQLAAQARSLRGVPYVWGGPRPQVPRSEEGP